MMSPEKNQPFTIFPAIDLRRGQVVRLQEGDPERQKAYHHDPAAIAERWLAAGAMWLHVVNLDGALGEGGSANRTALAAILTVTNQAGIPVQFGGGLRSLEDIARVLDLGVSRAVLGTAAVEQPDLVRSALSLWGAEAIAAGLDTRDGLVRVRGWQQDSGRLAIELAKELAASGLRWMVHTDIARDGMQAGLNIDSSCELALTTGLQVIASGGVAGWEDIRSAHRAGLPGVIVGKALYEGIFQPEELFRYPNVG